MNIYKFRNVAVKQPYSENITEILQNDKILSIIVISSQIRLTRTLCVDIITNANIWQNEYLKNNQIFYGGILQ